MTDKLVVFTACGSAAEAERIARALVEEKLAACVQIVGSMTSVYRWKGALETSPESLLLIKSDLMHWTALSARLTALHSYEVPEIVAVRAEEVAHAYASWMQEALHA